MTRPTLFALVAVAGLLPCLLGAQTKTYTLDSADGLALNEVTAEAATLDGKRGVRLTVSPQAAARMQKMTQQETAANPVEPLAILSGVNFSSGVIEAEIAGAAAAGAFGGARGFVGIAFRVQEDRKTYDAFYLRPTNGRAEDQERRNHLKAPTLALSRSICSATWTNNRSATTNASTPTPSGSRRFCAP